MDFINDKIIVAELRKGNKDVFQALFHQYYPLLAKFAHRYINDNDACEDLIQDVFATLWEKRKEIEINSLKSYLFVAIKNKCLGYLRHCGVKDRNEVFLIEAYLESSGELDTNTELIKKVKQCLTNLPDSMRDIFEKKYVIGLKAVDIAEDMDISINTVNTQLKRAKNRIRTELLESGIKILFIFPF